MFEQTVWLVVFRDAQHDQHVLSVHLSKQQAKQEQWNHASQMERVAALVTEMNPVQARSLAFSNVEIVPVKVQFPSPFKNR